MITTATLTLATVPILMAFVQLLKKAGLPAKLSPLVSVILGVIFAVGDYYAFGTTENVYAAVVFGLTLGLSAAGLYDGAKIATEAVRKPKHAAEDA